MAARHNLALVVDNTSKALHPRLIVIEYSGGHVDRVARAATLDGAMRSSVLRVAQGQYSTAKVYDCRFGSQSLAFTVYRSHRGLGVQWTKVPKWGHHHG